MYLKKLIRIPNNKDYPSRFVCVSNIKIQVRNQIGDAVQDDCTCNNKYMIDAMKLVGNAICLAYY